MPSHAIVFESAQDNLRILRDLHNTYSRLEASHPRIFIDSTNAWESLADSIQLYIDWLEIPSKARDSIPSMVSQKIRKTLIDNIFIKVSSIMETSWREMILQSLNLALPEIGDVELFVHSRIRMNDPTRLGDSDSFAKLQKKLASEIDDYLPFGKNPKYETLKDSLNECSSDFWKNFESIFSQNFKGKILNSIIQHRNDIAHDNMSSSISESMIPVAIWYGFEVSRMLIFVYEKNLSPIDCFNYITHLEGDYYDNLIENILRS